MRDVSGTMRDVDVAVMAPCILGSFQAHAPRCTAYDRRKADPGRDSSGRAPDASTDPSPRAQALGDLPPARRVDARQEHSNFAFHAVLGREGTARLRACRESPYRPS